MNILLPDKIPVLLCGMWRASPDMPNSGAKVQIQEKSKSPVLLSGFSDKNGEFRGTLPAELAGKTVRLVVAENGFLFDSYESILVERWGLFLPIRSRKDLNQIGAEASKITSTEAWRKWNEAEEFAEASNRTHAAARFAKVALPLSLFSILIGAASAYFTPNLNTLEAVIVGITVAVALNIFSRWVLLNGY